MATIVKHAIRTTEGWNSMSSAEQAQYAGYYTTLSAWRTARFAANPNLVTADVVEVAECFNDWPNGLNDAVNLNGFTVDSTRYIKITVAQGHRHIGIPRSGFFMYTSADFSSTIRSDTLQHTRVEYMDLRNNSTSTDATAISLTTSGLASNCLLTCKSSRAIASIGGDTTKIVNTLFYNGARGVTGGTYPGGVLYNCVFYNLSVCAVGASSTLGYGYKVVNCVALNAPSGVTGGEIYYKTGTQNNYTSGTTDVCFTKSGTVEADFIDPIGLDLHSAQYSRLHRMGINLYSDGIIEDIDGNPLPATGPWDIGINYKQPDITRAKPRRSWMLGTGTKPPTNFPSLILPKRFTQQPQYPVELSNIALELGVKKLLIPGVSKIDLYSNRMSSTVDTYTNTTRFEGSYVTGDNSGYRTYPSNGLENPAKNISVFALGYQRANYSWFMVGAGQPWLGGWSFLHYRENSNVILSLLGEGMTNKQENIICGTFPSSGRFNIGFRAKWGVADGLDFYSNRVFTNRLAPTLTTPGASVFRFGSNIETNNYKLGNNTDVEIVVVADQFWSASDFYEIQNNPYSLLKSSPQRTYFNSSSRPITKTEDSYPVTRTVSSPAPSLILPKKYTRKPSGKLTFNANSPLANLIDALIVPTETGFIDVYNEIQSTQYGSQLPESIITPVGLGRGYNRVNSTNGCYEQTPFKARLLNDTCEIFCWAFRSYVAPSEYKSSMLAMIGTGYISCEYSVANLAGAVGGFPVNRNAVSNTVPAVYSDYKFSTWWGTDNKVHMQSNLSTTIFEDASSSSATLVNGTAFVRLGTNGYTADPPRAITLMGAVFSRELLPEERYYLHNNTLELFKPIKRRIITGV